jgi:DNA-binding transcriptional ArsR family regulator
MTPETFRHWLADRGCTFEQHGRDEEGLPAVTVRREGRRAVLYDATSHKDLDPEAVRRIVEELELDWRELPGPASRV